MKKVLAFTSIRSDYDLMSGVYKALNEAPDVELKLLVSGAHLSPAFGETVRDIRRDGFPILAEVETLISGDTTSARLKTAAGLLYASIDLIKAYQPDLLLYAGDREDVLVGATMGAFLRIPTAHFFGGDHACDGHVDNPVRHATTKLSSAHFVSIDEHRQRVLALGEDPSRVFVIGSVAIDKFLAEPKLSKSEVCARMSVEPEVASQPWALLIFHPVEQERHMAADFLTHAVERMVARGYHVFIGAPNADPGNAGLVHAFERMRRKPQVTYYGNVPRALFVNLMRHTAVMIGNSSAGILEAATLRIPVVNLGERQRGRTCGRNVIFANLTCEALESALDQVVCTEFVEAMHDLVNPYGSGDSAKVACELIRTVDFKSMVAKWEDPLHG